MRIPELVVISWLMGLRVRLWLVLCKLRACRAVGAGREGGAGKAAIISIPLRTPPW